MKVFKLTSLAVALAALPLMGSCADQEESIIIAGAPAWPTGMCAVEVPAAAFLDRGRLDVRFGTQYVVPLEIQNQLTAQDPASTNSGTDNSELQITGVDVRISSAQRTDLIERLETDEGEEFVDFSPAVPTDSLTGGGSRGYAITGIPAATAAKLAEYRVEEAVMAGETAAQASMGAGATEAETLNARLIAQTGVLQAVETFVVSIVVRARRSGNRSGSVGEIESRQFDFPIDVCHGCLASCASCSFDVDLDADGEKETTIAGQCPDTAVQSTPTSPLFFGDFVGTSLNCPSAQDGRFVPAVCGI